MRSARSRSAPVAALGVFFQDVQHALPVALTLLSYLTPIYYPLSYVPERFQMVYGLNPFVGLINLYHAILYEGRVPSLLEFLVPVLVSLLCFGIGLLLYRWKRDYFAEVV